MQVVTKTRDAGALACLCPVQILQLLGRLKAKSAAWVAFEKAFHIRGAGCKPDLLPVKFLGGVHGGSIRRNRWELNISPMQFHRAAGWKMAKDDRRLSVTG